MGNIPIIIGVDEVGMGSPAGPMLICAAAFNQKDRFNPYINDSKQVPEKMRQTLCWEIHKNALAIGVSHVWADYINEHGMNGSWNFCVRTALLEVFTKLFKAGYNLTGYNKATSYGAFDRFDPHDRIIIDGPMKKDPNQFIPKELLHVKLVMKSYADRNFWQVGAASIVAKVLRDGMMVALAPQYPEYGWEDNKGYMTDKHIFGILQRGFTHIHRRSWKINIKPEAKEAFEKFPDNFERWQQEFNRLVIQNKMKAKQLTLPL